MANNRNHTPFIFPLAKSTVLPDPSKFFPQNLLSKPLPTDSFFQNFVLNNGDKPEYIHPYLIKSSNSSLSLSYPSRQVSADAICQVFNPDLTISSKQSSNGKHVISSFSDLSVTLDFPSSNLVFFLVRGSPYLTLSLTKLTILSIATVHDIHSFSSNNSHTKYTFQVKNGQTWLLYASSPINLGHTLSEITSNAFSGIIRIALLPDSDSKHETVLDKYSSSYPVSGVAVFREPFCVEYKWEKNGFGDLLLLAHPLHLQLLYNADSDVFVLDDFKYRSIDGDLVGVVGNSWVLKTDPLSVTWHSTNGVKEESCNEIVSALYNDVEGLQSSSMTTTSSLCYVKLIARAARLALVAEELCYLDVIPKVIMFLKESIEPWLEGSFSGNGFLHDKSWGGIITNEGCSDGIGIYKNDYSILGYILYGIAVLTKFDPAWGRKFKPQAYSLVENFMNLDTRSNPNYTRLRCFDLFVLHSWAGGLTDYPGGRYQHTTSVAVSAYYFAALMGLAYGDARLVALGSTLMSLEILAAKMWCHVEEGGNIYEKEFTEDNRIMGVLWANKRVREIMDDYVCDKACRLARQVLPLVPITEVIFSNVGCVKQLVEWTLPDLNSDDVDEIWKGFVYALEGIYDKESALQKIRKLKGIEDGNSLTNLLWWIHSRADKDGDEQE